MAVCEHCGRDFSPQQTPGDSRCRLRDLSVSPLPRTIRGTSTRVEVSIRGERGPVWPCCPGIGWWTGQPSEPIQWYDSLYHYGRLGRIGKVAKLPHPTGLYIGLYPTNWVGSTVSKVDKLYSIGGMHSYLLKGA